MAAAQEFFTLGTVGTLAGAIGAVTVVSISIRQLTGWSSPLVPFILSLLLTYSLAGTADTLLAVPADAFPTAAFWRPLVGWAMPLFNACILFTSVVGTTIAAEAIEERATSPAGGMRATLSVEEEDGAGNLPERSQKKQPRRRPHLFRPWL